MYNSHILESLYIPVYPQYYYGSSMSLKFIFESLIAIKIPHQILINPQDKAAMGI